MSDVPPVPAATYPIKPTDRSPATVLFLWVTIQLLTLAIAALRVPLWTRFPSAGEQFALHGMIAVQVTAGAVLFPFLLRDVISTAGVILTSLPFLQLAAYLSSAPTSRVAGVATYLACWIITLALWRRTLAGVALAMAWSVGGVIVWYAAAESGTRAPVALPRSEWFGPILGGFSQLDPQRVVALPWVIAAVLLLIVATDWSRRHLVSHVR